MKKVFILDTNVLLNDPGSLFKFDDNDVVIPISVIEEIDTFKKDQSETGRNAREVSRILDGLREKGTFSSGVKLLDQEDSGSLFVYLGQCMTELSGLPVNGTDNHILAIGSVLQKQFGESRRVVIITKDTNLRIKSDALGIPAENYEADQVDLSQQYTGVVRIAVGPTQQKAVATGGVIKSPMELAPNQFVMLADEEEEEEGEYLVLAKHDSMGAIRRIRQIREPVWGIQPRNNEQSFALEALLDDRIQLVTLSGGAGTGKTLLAMAAGLSRAVDDQKYHKILVARPIFPLGKDIGFLPGDLEEKLNPWMQPIYDNLELLLSSGVKTKQKRSNFAQQELINQGLLQVEPLTYIRGRSLPNIFFVVDESQNLTPHEMKTILTRAGEGTKIVLTGDPYQIDNPYVDSQSNGLSYVIEKFKNEKIAAHVTLTQGERSQLASLAAELL